MRGSVPIGIEEQIFSGYGHGDAIGLWDNERLAEHKRGVLVETILRNEVLALELFKHSDEPPVPVARMQSDSRSVSSSQALNKGQFDRQGEPAALSWLHDLLGRLFAGSLVQRNKRLF